jgi:hypothetical protein
LRFALAASTGQYVQLALECADSAAITNAVSAAEAMHLQTPLLAEARAMRARIAAAESALCEALRKMDELAVGPKLDKVAAMAALEKTLDECRSLQSTSHEVSCVRADAR